MSGLDRNGYAPSIIQDDLSVCFLCGCSDEKLDRHEVFGAANRSRSKRLGLWVCLCHSRCHLKGVHADAAMAGRLKQAAQNKAMEHYNWSNSDFIREFGKNYL